MIEDYLLSHPNEEILRCEGGESSDSIHFEITTRKNEVMVKYTHFDNETSGWREIKINNNLGVNQEPVEVIKFGNSIITIYTGYHPIGDTSVIGRWFLDLAKFLEPEIEKIMAAAEVGNQKKILRS